MSAPEERSLYFALRSLVVGALPTGRKAVNARVEVTWDDQSWDEMMIGFFNLVFDADLPVDRLFAKKPKADIAGVSRSPHHRPGETGTDDPSTVRWRLAAPRIFVHAVSRLEPSPARPRSRLRNLPPPLRAERGSPSRAALQATHPSKCGGVRVGLVGEDATRQHLDPLGRRMAARAGRTDHIGLFRFGLLLHAVTDEAPPLNHQRGAASPYA